MHVLCSYSFTKEDRNIYKMKQLRELAEMNGKWRFFSILYRIDKWIRALGADCSLLGIAVENIPPWRSWLKKMHNWLSASKVSCASFSGTQVL